MCCGVHSTAQAVHCVASWSTAPPKLVSGGPWWMLTVTSLPVAAEDLHPVDLAAGREVFGDRPEDQHAVQRVRPAVHADAGLPPAVPLSGMPAHRPGRAVGGRGDRDDAVGDGDRLRACGRPSCRGRPRARRGASREEDRRRSRTARVGSPQPRRWAAVVGAVRSGGDRVAAAVGCGAGPRPAVPQAASTAQPPSSAASGRAVRHVGTASPPRPRSCAACAVSGHIPPVTGGRTRPLPPGRVSRARIVRVSVPALAAALDLAAHPEGGWYRRTWTSTVIVDTPGGPRPSATAMLYLLDDVSRWHRVRSAELWCWHSGSPIELRHGRHRQRAGADVEVRPGRRPSTARWSPPARGRPPGCSAPTRRS